MKLFNILLSCLLLLFVSFSALALENENLLLGNPSNARDNTSNPNNYLMVKDQYSLSYNKKLNTPNWVSWHLDYNDIGDTERSKSFTTDKTLPEGWYRVTSNDYKGTNYNRGHMCPSADRTASRIDNKATFVMTNVIPQTPENNQGPWAKLENYSRDLVREGKELYIISGQHMSIGHLKTTGNQKIYVPSNGWNSDQRMSVDHLKTTGTQKINVPLNVWKIIIVLDDDEGLDDLYRIDNEGLDDLYRITEDTRVIAVVMPNTRTIRHKDWDEFLVSVDYIEELTGDNYLSKIPDEIEKEIEKKSTFF